MIVVIFFIVLFFVGIIFGVLVDLVFKLIDNDFDYFLKDKEIMLVDFYVFW